MSPVVRLSILIAGVLLCGCSDSNRQPTFKTFGTVKYEDGTPIEEGSVLFVAEGLRPGRGLIQGGEYTLGTYEESDGVVAGKFQAAVIVSPPIDYDPDDGKPPPIGAKAKYGRPETSGLEFEVTADGENRFDITLQRGR